MKTLNSRRLLAGLVIVGLAACGGGSKNNSATNGDTSSAENKDLVAVDEGTPSVDDKSQFNGKNLLTAASVGGLGLGAVLMTWGPSKVEALRKLLVSIDPNEAMKINKKLLDLVETRREFDRISKTLPTQIDDVLKGSVENAETEKIRDKLAELFVKRSQRAAEIASLQASIANVQEASQKPLTSGSALEIKNGSTSVANYLDALYAQKPEAQIDPEFNKTQMANMQKSLSLANTGLAQIDSEIEKVLKANAKVFKIFQNWSLLKNRLSQIAQSFDVGFHKVLRGLIRSMIRVHANRVKISFVDAQGNRVYADDASSKRAAIDVLGARILRKNFNLARVAYMTAGGFVIVGSGFTLWTTLQEADTDGHTLALQVNEVILDGEELPSQQEAAALSRTK